jgi:hypothetical protein
MTDISNSSQAASSHAPQPLSKFLVAQPGMDFNEASAAVVDSFRSFLPMGSWAVTRFDGLRQLDLGVSDDSYGLGSGGFHLWVVAAADEAMYLGKQHQRPAHPVTGCPSRVGDGCLPRLQLTSEALQLGLMP